MKLSVATAILAGVVAAPVFAGGHASGDAEAGESAFKQCRSCHSVIAADGTAIVKGGKTGPNLFGLPGQVAGTVEDFGRYKKSIVAAGDGGLVWDEANFVAYLLDPNGFLKEATGDDKARSGMSYRVRKEDDAVNIWAYIASVSPEPES